MEVVKLPRKQPYNKQFDEEKYKLVNKYNKNALTDWLQQMKCEKKSKKTLYQYERNVKLFYIWVYDEQDNVPIYQLKKKQFRNYLLYLQDLGLHANRVNSMKSAVSSMLNYLEDDEEYPEIQSNYMAKIKGLPKDEAREIIFLTDEQIGYLYKTLIKSEKYQEALLLAILYDTGARKNEVYGLKLDYIDPEKNRTTKKVLGKRAKWFYLYYHQRTQEAYKLYVATRDYENDELWCKEPNHKYTIDWMYSVVKGWNKIIEGKYGEYLDFNVHSFRHAFATNMTNGTHYVCKKKHIKLSLTETQLILNHESAETTQNYIKRNDEEVIANAFGWDKE